MRNMIMVAGLSLIAMLSWAQAAPDASPGQAPDEEPSHHGQRGPGVAGTVTAIDNRTITLKTFDGKTAQVSTTNQTEFRKDRQAAKLADFKPGDQVFVRGEQKDGVWQARMVAARSGGGPGGDFREALGKRFIIGEIKAINGTRLTILRPDGVSQDITVDENTSFRKDNESITLADLKAGDHVFGRGELKQDTFVPTVLNVGEPHFGGRPPESR